MNRMYITSYDGRIFFAEPSSKSFELLDFHPANEHSVKVKHLSSCEWCLWAISAQFGVFVFVFKLNTPIEHQEVTYENQVRIHTTSVSSKC